MSIEKLLLCGLLVVLCIYFFWAAYQIQVNNRFDLIQVGSSKRLKLSPHKRQFAALHTLHGLTCLFAGLILAISNSFTLGIWIFVGLSCALSVRRQLLLRAIEIYESKTLAN